MNHIQEEKVTFSSLIHVVKVEGISGREGVRVGIGDVPDQVLEDDELALVGALHAIPRVGVLAGHVEVAGHADDGGLGGQDLSDPLLVTRPLVVLDFLQYVVLVVLPLRGHYGGESQVDVVCCVGARRLGDLGSIETKYQWTFL